MNYLPHGHGWIEVITGPMYSEKTTNLISRIKKEVIAGKRAIVFKPNIDDRYATEHIMTHDGEKLHANSIPCDDSKQILENVHESVDVVGIDEGQFFDLGLIDVCEELANRGLRVIVAGVDMDYRCQPWRPMSDLMAKAEVVDKLTAVCFKCGKPATKIQRFRNGKLSHWDESTIAVGSNRKGDEYTYEARCRGCYIKPPRKIEGRKGNE